VEGGFEIIHSALERREKELRRRLRNPFGVGLVGSVGLGCGVCSFQCLKFDSHRCQFQWVSPYRVKTLALNGVPASGR
jgi:hypothetical protein